MVSGPWKGINTVIASVLADQVNYRFYKRNSLMSTK